MCKYFVPDALANQVWDEKGWTNDDMERLSKQHMRTPYKKNS